MTREEAIFILRGKRDISGEKTAEALDMAIKALEQEPCVDAISRQAVMEICNEEWDSDLIVERIGQLPSITPQPKTGHCKECKYFEYDSVAKVDGIPLIVAHEICKKWGDGCKTKEDGYCFLFEPKESEE